MAIIIIQTDKEYLFNYLQTLLFNQRGIELDVDQESLYDLPKDITLEKQLIIYRDTSEEE